MKTSQAYNAFACIVAMALVVTHAQAKSTQEIYDACKDSVVLIISYDKANIPRSQGSAFFVKTNIVASNYHVVKGASSVSVRTGESTLKASRIVGYSKSLDLVLIEVPASGRPLKVSERKGLRVGDKVVTIGNPRGLEGTVSEGIISAIRDHDGLRILQITAPISPGSSGGPVFNVHGEVIGIATATLEHSQNLNFALAVALLNKLPRDGKSWEPIVSGPVLPKRRGSEGVRLAFWKHNGPIITCSLKNDTLHTVKNLEYLLVFRHKRSGDILHYVQCLSRVTIAPGMGKIVEEIVDEVYTLGGIYNIEFRLLSYDIVDEPSSLTVGGRRLR